MKMMKKQTQIIQTRKSCLTNGKFALLLLSTILSFTSCKQSENQNSESISEQVGNLISSSPCDKFIGKYSRQQTASSITTTSNIEFKKNQDFYKLFITAISTTNNPSLQIAVDVTNERFKATFPSDGIVCTCNDKDNIEINVEGKRIEAMIDNSGNLIYGGLTFYKTNNESKSEVTEEVTEVAEVQENVNVSANNLPFIGKRKFNFMGGSGTEEVIIIKKDGYTILKSVGNYGESINYEGPYKNILDMPAGDESTMYYKINGNTISMVDANGKIEKNCKGDNTPCTVPLEEY